MNDDHGHDEFPMHRDAATESLGPGPAMRDLEAAVARVMRTRQGPQAATCYLRSRGWSVDDALNALARRESSSDPIDRIRGALARTTSRMKYR